MRFFILFFLILVTPLTELRCQDDDKSSYEVQLQLGFSFIEIDETDGFAEKRARPTLSFGVKVLQNNLNYRFFFFRPWYESELTGTIESTRATFGGEFGIERKFLFNKSGHAYLGFNGVLFFTRTKANNLNPTALFPSSAAEYSMALSYNLPMGYQFRINNSISVISETRWIILREFPRRKIFPLETVLGLVWRL